MGVVPRSSPGGPNAPVCHTRYSYPIIISHQARRSGQSRPLAWASKPSTPALGYSRCIRHVKCVVPKIQSIFPNSPQRSTQIRSNPLEPPRVTAIPASATAPSTTVSSTTATVSTEPGNGSGHRCGDRCCERSFGYGGVFYVRTRHRGVIRLDSAVGHFAGHYLHRVGGVAAQTQTPRFIAASHHPLSGHWSYRGSTGHGTDLLAHHV